MTGLAALALSASVSACGSSSSSSSKLAKTDLIAKANGICSTAQSAAKAVPQPSNLQDATQAAAYFDKIAPITDTETKSLQALTPADDVKSEWQAFVDQQVAADTLLQTIKSKADAKDQSGLADLQKVQPQGQKVANAATKLGASTCAQ